MKKDKSKALKKPARNWGGARPGAGRKPNGDKAGVSHLRRAELSGRHPVRVTWEMLPHVSDLQSKRCFLAIESAVEAGHSRFGLRVVQLSVEDRQLQLIVKADDERSLARGLQGMGIRVSKALNRVMEEKGKVLADRYLALELKNPAELRKAKKSMASGRTGERSKEK